MPCPAGSEWVVGPVTAKVVVDGIAKGNSLLGGGPWRDVILQCSWAESDTLIDRLLGVVTWVGPIGGPISWPMPYAYPGNTNLFALEASATPKSAVKPDVTRLVDSDYAHVTVHFGVPPFDVYGSQPELAFGGQPVPWGRDTCRGYLESVPIERAAIEDAGNDNPATKFELKVPHVEFHRTRLMVPYLNLSLLSTLVGKINALPMWGFARGTFRLEPWDTSVEITTDGSRVTTLDTSMTWRPYDWNMKPDANGTWVAYNFITNPRPIYEYADLTPVFAP